MAGLHTALVAAGFGMTNAAYPSTRFDSRTLTDEFILPLIRAHSDPPRLHLTGHSMGCLLIRAALAVHRPDNLGRVVMLAPGNSGSEMLEVQRRIPLMQWLCGPAIVEGGIGSDSFAFDLPTAVDYEVGILAGTVSFDPMSAWLPWPHDGKLSVGRTRLDGAKGQALVPAPHDLIQFHPYALWQTLNFLRTGHFHKDFA